MEKEERYANWLLASCLCGDYELFDEKIDYDKLYKILEQQCVSALVAQYIIRQIKDNEEKNKYRESYLKCISRSVQFISEQNRLNQLFESQGLKVVVLKGASAAQYYPNPLLRECGDIDYITTKEDFDDVVELLTKDGYVQNHNLDTNECHIVLKKNIFSIELHYQWVANSMTNMAEEINSFVFSGFESVKNVGLYRGMSFMSFDKLHNGIILLQHANRHMIQGIGLRQVCDWMMYVKNNLDNGFWHTSFSKYTDLFGLTTFAITLTRTCQIYLGLSEIDHDWCKSADEKLCSELMDFVLRSGNLGKFVSTSHKGKVAFVLRPIHIRYRIKVLQERGQKNWMTCHKYPIPKSVAWVYQICRYAKKGIGESDGIHDLISDIKFATKERRLVEKLKGY